MGEGIFSVAPMIYERGNITKEEREIFTVKMEFFLGRWEEEEGGEKKRVKTILSLNKTSLRRSDAQPCPPRRKLPKK